MYTDPTFSCDWPSAGAALDDIETHQFNVTKVVKDCANVCGLVFESNNAVIFYVLIT
jgi:hypothetical protein